MRGTFAARLLDHLSAIKDDRVKTGSDLIVQAARGFRPDSHRGWVKRYQPCQMILFEDLPRYLFRTDRPRRENSRLMRWSHREIFAQTTMQGEVYGIGADTTGAGFTSRFHARTGAARLSYPGAVGGGPFVAGHRQAGRTARRAAGDRRSAIDGRRPRALGGR